MVTTVLAVLVALGALPMAVSLVGYLLLPLHARAAHLDRAVPGTHPRITVLVPAWNEAAVLRYSVDRTLTADYPPDRLRLLVVDDASTDDTPAVLAAARERWGVRVDTLRRDRGGQGKAHTLNAGLERILAADWTDAVLITDADVVFAPDAVAHLARHLADPEVGAVTAFIREGSRPAPGITRSIGFEYAAAQLAARRTQNVIGAQACLAGGAQLLTRENLLALGGAIDTGTLAEDTVTTLLTQVHGRRVVFDPHAECLAEEPASIDALWRQRLRWARGNIGVTRRFHRLFFRPSREHHLGNVWFGLQWYCTLLLPVLMVCSSAALVLTWLIDRSMSTLYFQGWWAVNALAFVFTTAYTLLLDRDVARRSWWQALTFPGLINVAVIVWVIAPGPISGGWSEGTREWVQLAAMVWISACMLAAWGLRRLERVPRLGGLARTLLPVVGFGPLLCAITAAAYVAEARGASRAWEKTEKTGKVAAS